MNHPEEVLLSHKMTRGQQLGGGAALKAVEYHSLDNPALTASSDPPILQMPLLLSLSRSSKTSLMTHSARSVTLGYMCPSGPTTEPSLLSPPLKGNMHTIGVTGPVCDLSPSLIPLASQGLCGGGEEGARG